MSSDSSDVEDLEKLREAADTQFINDTMFDKERDTVIKELTVERLPSLRPSKNEDEQFNLFRVSPEFRGYVAKQLSKILDHILQKKLSDLNHNNKYIKRKRRKSGIKLFHNSSHYLKVETSTSVTHNHNKTNHLKNIPEDEDDPNDDKYRSVAISPNYILSKKETDSWSKRSKAPIYTYIKTSQGLVLK